MIRRGSVGRRGSLAVPTQREEAEGGRTAMTLPSRYHSVAMRNGTSLLVGGVDVEAHRCDARCRRRHRSVLAVASAEQRAKEPFRCRQEVSRDPEVLRLFELHRAYSLGR